MWAILYFSAKILENKDRPELGGPLTKIFKLLTGEALARSVRTISLIKARLQKGCGRCNYSHHLFDEQLLCKIQVLLSFFYLKKDYSSY